VEHEEKISDGPDHSNGEVKTCLPIALPVFIMLCYVLMIYTTVQKFGVT